MMVVYFLLVQEKRDETRVFQGPAQKAGRRELPKAWQRFWTHKMIFMRGSPSWQGRAHSESLTRAGSDPLVIRILNAQSFCTANAVNQLAEIR